MDNAAGVSVEWAASGAAPVQAPCRSCGAPGPKQVMLAASADLPHQPRLEEVLLACPDCGCAFVPTVPGYRYEGDAVDDLSIDTYIEVGAGLWPMARTLAPLPAPPGARFLEIGCGFGFGLDFAIRARGWQGRGIDPSPLADAGRLQLGLPIERRFFGTQPADLAAPGQPGADIILASEVVEHMADPVAFLGTLRDGLAPGGILVLTTPDRAQLHPDMSFAQLLPILSVGAHLTIQTASSLRMLLARAGFAEIQVAPNGAQLVAYASQAQLALRGDAAAWRQSYRFYLQARAETALPDSPLWWGFVSRAYQEAVADHDAAAAAPLWQVVRTAWRAAFGFDPEHPNSLPYPAGPKLRDLAACMPKASAAMLYARALHRLQDGDRLADVAALLEAAAMAAEQLNAALLPAGAADLSALSAQRACLAALMTLAADAAVPATLDALARAAAADPLQSVSLARSCLVGLVNAGAHAQAAALLAAWDIDGAALEASTAAGTMSRAERDTLFCLGILALHQAGTEASALDRFAGVRASLDRDAPAEPHAPDSLFWAALRGECVALDRLDRHVEGTALLRAAESPRMPADLLERLSGAG